MAEAKGKNEELEVENEELAEEVEKTAEELEDEVAKLKKENGKYYEHLQRTAAEFDNYKKRISKEKDSIYKLAVGDVVLKYIPIVDNLEKAIQAETQDEKMKEGVELIYKQLLEIMTSLGVEQVEAVNQPFNPEFHEAVMHIEDENYGEKIVVEDFRKGYKMGDRVLRHSMVKVAN
ncbi:MAG: nucleotide exchange factor GrpE [Clostridia bacterium]|nr:nucleotide exchange factor GrpE [Clostridia bacterium]